MATTVCSAAIVGLDARIVDVEADVSRGLPKMFIVGLPDTAIQEAKERVRSGIRNSCFDFPPGVVTVNLAPADIKKEGSGYDLPIAIAILQARGEVHARIDLRDKLFVGELSLDGSIRPVPGVLSMAMAAATNGKKELFVPAANAAEASLVKGVTIYPVKHLGDVVDHLNAGQGMRAYRQRAVVTHADRVGPDLRDVRGQEQVKRALEIAAAGGHNVLMTGPPGSGKTLLARCLPGILPAMSYDESLEVTKIYSVAGQLQRAGIIHERPFRTPHHTTSSVALVGGGSIPQPGEISLAHRGVLFLDEFPEFARIVLESLRQPLEDGVVTVSRAAGSAAFPARFMLVAAQNPCPCGYLYDERRSCTCSPLQILRYHKKISGPLLDRIDIHVQVPRLDYDQLVGQPSGEPSAIVRERVEAARQRQIVRSTVGHTNSEFASREIPRYCQMDEGAEQLLKRAVDQFYLSGRVYHRILKVARTIADLGGAEHLTSEHIAEALQYRPQSPTD